MERKGGEDSVSLVGTIIGGIASLGGLLSASASARRAEALRQSVINEMALENDRLYQSQLGSARRSLLSASGISGDALTSLGSRLGDALASSGVYNSSSVSGALDAARRDELSRLASLGESLENAARERYYQGRMGIGQARLGIAGQQALQSQSDLQAARSGLASFLGALSQSNLMRSGANAYRPMTLSLGGNELRGELPGNAGWWLRGSGFSASKWRRPVQSFERLLGAYEPLSRF